MGAVDGLAFHGWVPPRVEQIDVVGGGQVEAESAGFQADQEQLAVRVVLEALDPGLPIAGAAVEVFRTGLSRPFFRSPLFGYDNSSSKSSRPRTLLSAVMMASARARGPGYDNDFRCLCRRHRKAVMPTIAIALSVRVVGSGALAGLVGPEFPPFGAVP
jgi:hypothetical protein